MLQVAVIQEVPLPLFLGVPPGKVQGELLQALHQGGGLGDFPHAGGPVIGPGAPTVLIGKLPAAVMGDMCICTGPPDSIIKGSATVMIGGKPAARMGDTTAHGGVIVAGCPTVQIGG